MWALAVEVGSESRRGALIEDLWDSLNRVIHAKKLVVGWERLPDKVSVIANGAVVIPYIQVETDRRALAFIDPFAIAHAFLYQALPKLYSRDELSGQIQ